MVPLCSEQPAQPSTTALTWEGKIPTGGLPRLVLCTDIRDIVPAQGWAGGAVGHLLTGQHLHQDLPEGVGLVPVETLALVEAGVVGLKVPQCDGEGAPQGVIHDGRAPVPPLQERQQPRAVRADHPLARALLLQLAAPGFASPPVLQGVVGAGDLQGPARRALEHGGVVGSGQLWGGDIRSVFVHAPNVC